MFGKNNTLWYGFYIIVKVNLRNQIATKRKIYLENFNWD